MISFKSKVERVIAKQTPSKQVNLPKKTIPIPPKSKPRK